LLQFATLLVYRVKNCLHAGQIMAAACYAQATAKNRQKLLITKFPCVPKLPVDPFGCKSTRATPGTAVRDWH